MSNDKKLSPEEAAKKLQGMVSLGIPDTQFSGQTISTEPLPETIEKPEQEETLPIPSPARRKRREQPENFKDTYFRRVDFSDRQPLYITRSTHEKLMMIVTIIGGRKATIGSYVENIMLQHLESHREEINRLFEEYYLKTKNEL